MIDSVKAGHLIAPDFLGTLDLTAFSSKLLEAGPPLLVVSGPPPRTVLGRFLSIRIDCFWLISACRYRQLQVETG